MFRRPFLLPLLQPYRILGKTTLCLFVLVGCASPNNLRVKTDDDKASVMASHKTYSIKNALSAPSQFAGGTLTPEVLEKMAASVNTEMGKKGYVVTSNDPAGELVVRLSSGTRTSRDQPTGRAAVSGAPAEQNTERGLVVDIFEQGSDTHVFHGYARYDADVHVADDAKISLAVAEIFKPVPASAKK